LTLLVLLFPMPLQNAERLVSRYTRPPLHFFFFNFFVNANDVGASTPRLPGKLLLLLKITGHHGYR